MLAINARENAKNSGEEDERNDIESREQNVKN
jgi:hypothetical protein